MDYAGRSRGRQIHKENPKIPLLLLLLTVLLLFPLPGSSSFLLSWKIFPEVQPQGKEGEPPSQADRCSNSLPGSRPDHGSGLVLQEDFFAIDSSRDRQDGVIVNLVAQSPQAELRMKKITWITTNEGKRLLSRVLFAEEEKVQTVQNVEEDLHFEVLHYEVILQFILILVAWKLFRISRRMNQSTKLELIKNLKIRHNQSKLRLVTPLQRVSDIFQRSEDMVELSEEELFKIVDEIVGLSAENICQKIREKDLSAEVVMRCFCYKAIMAHGKFNCLTEQWMTKAIREAIAADEYHRKTGKTRGPLHGLPFSLKDTIDVEGIDSTVGIIKRSFKPALNDAVVVEMMKKAGAIPFVKTNVPQTISFECSNPLFGRTQNPFNSNFALGSSSGEGCLLAFSGSPAGFATDISGSIRISAHFTGTCGLKPTSGRFPIKGFVTQNERGTQDAIPGVIGPMARNVSDLILLTRSLLETRPWEYDCSCAPIEFNSKFFDSKEIQPLRIGYFVTDGLVDPTPPCARAVQEAITALQKAGHSVFPFPITAAAEGLELYFGLMSADGAQLTKDSLKWEPVEKYSRQIFWFTEFPSWIRIIAKTILNLMNQKDAATVIGSLKSKSMPEYWTFLKRKNEFRDKFMSEFRKSGADVLICPVTVLPAIPSDYSGNIGVTASYTTLFNLLDLPSGVLPVTTVQECDDFDPETFSKFGWFRRRIYKNYNKSQCLGLPVGVQIVGKRFQEETVLKAMLELENSLRNQKKPFSENN